MNPTHADFTWMWDDRFFLETDQGNFQWSDPDHGGTNNITSYGGSIEDYCKEFDIQFGRSKGIHLISVYCPGAIFIS